MNMIGIALVWCVLQVTLIGMFAAGLYLVVRRLRPAAAASVVFTSLAIVVVLSLMAVSPWPRWTVQHNYPVPLEEGLGADHQFDDIPPATDLHSLPDEVREVTVSGNEPVSVKNQPSAAALLWQSLLDELARPQPAASTNTWHWSVVVAVLLLTTMAFGLVWLLLGMLTVRGERLRSHTVLDRELLELVDVLRAELACRRPVEVCQSDSLATAATIGWRRPLLLLPNNWMTWTAEQRRAVLAHEIAHARSRDFLMLFFGQLAVMLHFYHPLLHWLMNRLRLEQELAADAAAASVSGGQWRYLTTIAELALHQQNRSLLWPARSFLPTQTTFLRRIAMLRNSQPRFDRLSPLVRLATVGAILLCGLLVAGLRCPGQPTQALAEEPSKVESQRNEDFPRDVKLNAAQRNYRNWTEEYFQGILDQSQWQKLPQQERNAKEEQCLKQLSSDDYMLRISAINVLAALNSKKAVPELLKIATEPVEKDNRDRWMAIRALGIIGDPSVVPELVQLTYHYNMNTRFWAQISLVRLTGENFGRDVAAWRQWWEKQDGKPPIAVEKVAWATSPKAIQWSNPEKMDEIDRQWATRKPFNLLHGPDLSRAVPNAIIEGIGWNGVRIGASSEELSKILGNADDDSTSDWLKWKNSHNIECTFHGGNKVAEVRFNPGFKGVLTNGLKLGSPGSKVLKLYGEPEHITERGNGAKKYEYSKKGILFWTYQGKITQIAVFKPFNVSGGQPVFGDTSSNNNFIEKQTREAKAGNYWAKYRLWTAYQKGTNGAAKNPEKAKQWLEQLVEGTYLATFRPINGFNPKTPREFLSQFDEHSNLKSEPKSVGGASFFRTRVENGVLIGSFITAYPDKMRKAVADNPSLELISIEKLTPEKFVSYQASPQESLNTDEETKQKKQP